MQQGFADAAAVHAYAKLSGDIYGSGKFRANNCIAASLGPGLLEAGALNRIKPPLLQLGLGEWRPGLRCHVAR